MTAEPPLRLRWLNPWFFGGPDFSCFAPEARSWAGRVYRAVDGAGETVWRWESDADVPSRKVKLSVAGSCRTKRDACLALEAFWFDFLARPWPLEGSALANERPK